MLTTLTNILVFALATFGALVLIGLLVGWFVSKHRRWWD
jgi:hypothetical protein